jgi:pyruvate-ferredoxin/flavodoxin oxidoreductase
MDELAERTGRRYGLVDYHGAPDAERVVVLMGSGVGARRGGGRRARRRRREGRLLRSACSAPSRPRRSSPPCPRPCAAIAVLDRTKEPARSASRSTQDVVAALAEADGREGRRSPRCRG